MEEPMRRIAPYLDAMNVDVKASEEGFYHEICGGQLEPVRRTCKLARELGIHLEITYLIIPTHNDSDEVLSNHCDWIVNTLGEEVPCHFSRFYPCYHMLDVPPTPMSTLERAYDIAKEKGIKYVYLGNVAHGQYENTYCPQCGELLIGRSGYLVYYNKVKEGRCPKCGTSIPIRLER
jgi:pyruvate formate lyase activating enzyme